MSRVSNDQPYGKKRGLISWLEGLGAVVDATTPNQVQDIRFVDGTVVNEHVISSLQQLPNLQCVVISNSLMTDELLSLLGAAVPNLCDFNLDGGKVTDAGLDSLSKHPLMRLSIPLNQSERKALRHFRRLREINLRGNPIKEASLNALLNLNRPIDYEAKGRYLLKRLDLRDTPVGDACVDTLVKLGASETAICGTQITDDGLARFCKGHSRWNSREINGPNITELGQHRAWLGSAKFMHFFAAEVERGLRVELATDQQSFSLNATGGDIANQDVVNFAWRDFPDYFSELSLLSPQLTDEIFAALAAKGMNKIRHVTLLGNYSGHALSALGLLGNISQLSIESNLISNDDLKHLQRLPNLRTLVVIAPSVDDDAIEILASCNSLREVDLKQTDCTEEGQLRLRTLLESQ